MVTVKIYAQQADGIITSDKKFDWKQSGTDGSQVDYSGSVGKVVASHKDSIKRYFRTRAFFYFDTSALPDDAIIITARLHIWGFQNENAVVVAQKGLQGSTLGMQDYTKFAGTEYGHVSWKSDQFNVIAFNAQGVSDINLSGITKVCCREYEHDYLDVPPQEGEEFIAGFFMSEIEGGAYRPYLEISYEKEEIPACSLNIQDINGQVVVGADVTVNCQGTIITGQTDNSGCVLLHIAINTICEIIVSKNNYKPYHGKIIVIPESQLTNPSNNFVLKIIDSGGAALPNVQASIISALHNYSGISNGSGLFEGVVKTSFSNQLTLVKPGFTPYAISLPPFPVIKCTSTGMRVLSVITLN